MYFQKTVTEYFPSGGIGLRSKWSDWPHYQRLVVRLLPEFVVLSFRFKTIKMTMGEKGLFAILTHVAFWLKADFLERKTAIPSPQVYS